MKPIQPHRVRLELPDGSGVVLEAVCALCREGVDGIICPICSRLFCGDGCYEVHLNARDAFDAPDAVRAFLRTPAAQAILEREFADSDFDWRHGLSCNDCSAELCDIVMGLLSGTPPAWMVKSP